MAQVRLNADELNNNVLPRVNNYKNLLEETKNQMYSIISAEMPSDFENQELLRILPHNLDDIINGVQSIANWIQEAVENLYVTERKNNELLDSINITASIDTLHSNSGRGQTGSELTSKSININIVLNKQNTGATNVSSFVSKVKNIVSSAANKVKDTIKSVGTKIANSVINKFKKIFDMETKVANTTKNVVKAGAKFISSKWNTAVSMVNNAVQGIRNTGTKVAKSVKSAVSKLESAGAAALQATKTVVASTTNAGMAILKGIMKIGEGIDDFVVGLGTGVASIATGTIDGLSYLGHYITGNKESYESLTATMWKNTAAYIVEDQVGNMFEQFYKQTAVGKWLDDNSIEALKSDGEVCNALYNLGYEGGLMAIVFFTVGTAGAIITGMATWGKTMEEEWSEKKKNSWLGIQEEYEKGHISKEEYEQYTQIRNMSQQEWESIIYQHQMGNITDEQFDAIKAIRELPEDWRTFENIAEGIEMGAAKGIWEGVNMYYGAKIGELSTKCASKFAASALRIGADSLIGAADTPYRVITEALIKGKDISEVWKENGGWQSFITNTLVATGMATIGELLDLPKKYAERQKNKKAGNINSTTTSKSTGNLEIEDNVKGRIESKTNTNNNTKTYSTIKEGKVSSFDEALDITLRKQGLEVTPENRKRLREKILNEGESAITRENGARDFVMENFTNNPDSVYYKGSKPELKMETDKVEIENKVKEKTNDLKKDINATKIKSDKVSSEYEAIKLTLEEQGLEVTSENIRRIYEKLDAGDISAITGKNGAREYIKKNVFDNPNNLRYQNKEIIEDQIEDSFEQNSKNLVQSIKEQVPKRVDDVTKARIAYLKLNNEVTYSDEYFARNTLKNRGVYATDEVANRKNLDILEEIYYKKVDISKMNVTDNNIVCNTWAQMYADLLGELGIDSSKIQIVGDEVMGKHKFVKVQLKRGKVLLADATNNIGGATDIANSKLNRSTYGFVITTEKEINELTEVFGENSWVPIFGSLNQGDVNKKILGKVDKKIGYNIEKNAKDFNDIVQYYSNNAKNTISTEDEINIFKSIFDKNIVAVESYPVMQEYLHKIFRNKAELGLYVKDGHVINTIKLSSNEGKMSYLYKINTEEVKQCNNIEEIIKGAEKLK